MIRLANATLAQLPGAVARPTYDRGALRAGIVHIGVGNFHRGHQAWYLHRLMQQGLAQDWAIIGAGVRPADAEMRARLLRQEGLFTLFELAPGGISAEVVGSLVDFLPVAEDNGPLIEAMAHPQIRIVSLTVTESGYFRDPATGGLDLAHPDIRHDIDRPRAPRTAFGAILAALGLRRAAGAPPFTVLSCDNLEGNGDVTRGAVLALARQTDPDLADWIAAEGAFPNSMVDCIVPATGARELALPAAFGLEDAAPVAHEDFRQWVIEDRFCTGRPDWDRAGATFTDRVHAFETLKIRMLNAGHQVLAAPGELLGLETVAACMADAQLRAFFDAVQRRDILPCVPPAPGVTPQEYLHLITRRFANAQIHDTTRRIAFDGLARHAGFLLPSLREARAAGREPHGLVLVEALWARMCAGTREDGSTIPDNDPQWARLQATARAARDEPTLWLDQIEAYGELAQDPWLRAAFAEALTRVWRDGTRAVIGAYAAG